MQRLVAPFLFVLIFASIVALPAHAQDVGSASVDPLTLSVDPAYPAPYQTVSLTPQSTVFDISTASISVSVNGTPLYKGTGGASIPVTMGGAGTATRISVTAVSAGQSYSSSLTIRPASVALVVEPVSTSHAFYSGRNLLPSQGRVRLVAVPDLRTSANSAISPSSLIYIWKLGDQELQDDSGIGKSVLDATAPQQYRDADITVTVQSQDGSILAQAGTNLSPTDPMVQIYKNDPLMGPLYDNALTGTITMLDTEDTYRGVPYYFSSTPAVSWTVNGTPSGSYDDLTVRANGSGQGTAVLGFSANVDNPILSAAETLSVLFGQKTSTGIFGLGL